LSLSLSSLAADNAAKNSASGTVFVEIDGAKLTAADVERKSAGALFQARNTYYQAERKAIDEFIEDYLLEKQAEKENLTVAQLLDKHVNKTIAKDPSDEALQVYFEGPKTTDTFEKLKPQILEHVRQIRIEKAKTAYIASLRAQASIAVRLPSPRNLVSMKNTPVRGNADAKVTLVEYADYECPYCQQIQPVLDRLEADFKGKLAFAYKDVPLPMHANAQKASEAAHCAGAQGKYWEFHDRLFSTKQLGVAQLREHATALNLDAQAFNKCLDSGSQADLVKGYLSEAQDLKLQGTPSFFINGRFFSGGLSYEELRSVVEEELAGPQGTQAAVR